MSKSKTCMGCKYAQWNKTKNGSLHQSGHGRCTYKVVIAPIPASMYWPGMIDPKPYGGFINRREELKKDCPCAEYVEVKKQ